jgi:hypothetical protein
MRADRKQVTIRATITDSTPGIVAALLADPRTEYDSPKGSPALFGKSNTAAISAEYVIKILRSGVGGLCAETGAALIDHLQEISGLSRARVSTMPP